MISAIKAVERSPLAPIAITGHYVLVIAFVLLGIGFWRAGIGPRWAAVLIALCGVVDSAEGLLGSTGHMLLGIVISDGMLIAGFAAVGWHLLREATEASTHATDRATTTPRSNSAAVRRLRAPLPTGATAYRNYRDLSVQVRRNPFHRSEST